MLKPGELRIGNVIKSPGGGVWILTDVSEIDDVDPDDPIPEGACLHAIAFDAENASAIQRWNDYTRTEACGACFDPDDDRDRDLCENCGGSGSVDVKVKGWKHSKLLAENAKALIFNALKKAMKL